MSRKFILAAVVTALTNLIIHSSAYFLFLKKFYAAYPAGPPDYLKPLNRPPGEPVIWASLVSAWKRTAHLNMKSFRD